MMTKSIFYSQSHDTHLIRVLISLIINSLYEKTHDGQTHNLQVNKVGTSIQEYGNPTDQVLLGSNQLALSHDHKVSVFGLQCKKKVVEI